MILSKKAVSELTSFVFITLIIVIASTSAYIVANNYLGNTLSTLDRDNMESYLKRMQRDVSLLTTFDNHTISFPIEFRTGELRFESNQVYFQSEVLFEESDTYCFSNICYQGIGGFERIYFNLTGNYTFQTDTELEPSDYIIILQHRKTDEEIQLRFR